MICQLGKMNVLTSFVMVILCVNFRRGIVSTYIIIVNNVLTLFLITIFAHTVNSFSIGRGRRSFTVDACPESSR